MINFKKIGIAVCLSLGLALGGCSTGAKSGNGAPVDDGTGASASGYGTGAGYGGSGSGTAVCRSAPATQSYYFDLNQYDVNQGDVACVNAQARYLVKYPNAKVRIEGNCDNRGSREYNRALGWKRANAVKSILLQQGVSPNQITTFSWGSEKAAAGTGEAVWSKDRRVDLIFK